MPEAYVEHAPPQALRPFVECIWTRRASPSSESSRPIVLPDGCIDIVLGYRSSAMSPDDALAVGTMTRPLVLADEQPSLFVGVRFWPGRAYPFLGIPASELTDLRVSVADVWDERTPELETLDATDVSGLVASLEALLLRRAGHTLAVNCTVDAAVRAILRARGNLSIATLAPALGVTRQYLARAFALHVGVPPKTFARVARVRNVLARARSDAKLNWSALALDAGYYDQAHLAGEVKELTGLTPSDWAGRVRLAEL
jgi:AraC-like DNA-binding protein